MPYSRLLYLSTLKKLIIKSRSCECLMEHHESFFTEGALDFVTACGVKLNKNRSQNIRFLLLH